MQLPSHFAQDMSLRQGQGARFHSDFTCMKDELLQTHNSSVDFTEEGMTLWMTTEGNKEETAVQELCSVDQNGSSLKY